MSTDLMELMKKIRFYLTEPMLDDDERKVLMKEIISLYSELDDQSSRELLGILIETLRDITIPRLTDSDNVELEKLNKKKLINLKHMFGMVVIVSTGMLVIGSIFVILLDLVMTIVRDGRSIVLNNGIIDWILYIFN